jgi:putative exporter of polyketide antibiotics
MTFEKGEEYFRKIFNPKLPEGTNNALVSAGIFIAVIIGLVIAIIGFTLLRRLIVKCKHGRYIDQLIITEIRRTLVFSSILRFALLGYMFIVVTSVKAVFGGKQRILFKNRDETINSLIFYLLFSFSILFPIGITLFLMIQGPQGLARESIIEKFRSLYLSVRLNNRVNLLPTINFLIRRAIVGTSIALLNNRY